MPIEYPPGLNPFGFPAPEPPSSPKRESLPKGRPPTPPKPEWMESQSELQNFSSEPHLFRSEAPAPPIVPPTIEIIHTATQIKMRFSLPSFLANLISKFRSKKAGVSTIQEAAPVQSPRDRKDQLQIELKNLARVVGQCGLDDSGHGWKKRPYLTSNNELIATSQSYGVLAHMRSVPKGTQKALLHMIDLIDEAGRMGITTTKDEHGKTVHLAEVYRDLRFLPDAERFELPPLSAEAIQNFKHAGALSARLLTLDGAIEDLRSMSAPEETEAIDTNTEARLREYVALLKSAGKQGMTEVQGPDGRSISLLELYNRFEDLPVTQALAKVDRTFLLELVDADDALGNAAVAKRDNISLEAAKQLNNESVEALHAQAALDGAVTALPDTIRQIPNMTKDEMLNHVMFGTDLVLSALLVGTFRYNKETENLFADLLVATKVVVEDGISATGRVVADEVMKTNALRNVLVLANKYLSDPSELPRDPTARLQIIGDILAIARQGAVNPDPDVRKMAKSLIRAHSIVPQEAVREDLHHQCVLAAMTWPQHPTEGDFLFVQELLQKIQQGPLRSYLEAEASLKKATASQTAIATEAFITAQVEANQSHPGLIRAYTTLYQRIESYVNEVERLPIDIEKMKARELSQVICQGIQARFAAIDPSEFDQLAWTTERRQDLAPNVVALIREFNQISSFVQHAVLNSEDPKAAVVKVIQAAKMAYQDNNYMAGKALTAGLRGSPVERLKARVWDRLSSSEGRDWEDLLARDSTSQNEKANRDPAAAALRAGQRVTPAITMFLTDLVKTNEGNPDKASSESVIPGEDSIEVVNLRRNINFGLVLEELRAFRNALTKGMGVAPPSPAYTASLEMIPYREDATENALYAKSLEVQPRVQS